MKTRAKTLAVLLLSGLFAASCAATSPPIFLEQEEELPFELEQAFPLAEQEEELTGTGDAFRDRAGPGTSTMDILDQEYGEGLTAEAEEESKVEYENGE